MRQFTIDEYIIFIIQRHFAYPSAPVEITSNIEIFKQFLQNPERAVIIRVCFNDNSRINIVTVLLGTRIIDDESKLYGIYINDEIIKQYFDYSKNIIRKFYISANANKLDIITCGKINDGRYLLNIATLTKNNEWIYTACIVNRYKNIELQLKDLKLNNLILNQIEAEWLIDDIS